MVCVNKQLTLIVALVFYGLALYELVLHVVTDNWWIIPLVGWLCSPLLLFVLRHTMERGVPGGIFNPKTQSWAFLFGDWIFLPVSLAALAWGAHEWYHEAGFGFVTYDSDGWQRICMALGMVAGFLFNVMDRKVYAKAGAHDAIFSPSKIAHDFVAYPVFVASLLYLAVPLLGVLNEARPAFAAGLVGLVLWGVMGVCDVKRQLHPFNLHPAWDGVKFEPREYLPKHF